MLNVAIAVDSNTDYGADAVRVVAAACEEVIGPQRCPVAPDLKPGTIAAWYAVVHPADRELSRVTIEFRDRTADGVLIERRSLNFAVGDTMTSRLESVGSVIAALAAAREGSLVLPLSPRASGVAPPAPLPPADSSSGVRSDAKPPDWSLDVAALIVPPLGDGPSRFGAGGGAHVALAERPFAVVGAGYAVHVGEPSLGWLTASIGAGARLRDQASRFNFELSGELVLERTSISAARGSAHETTTQNGGGGRITFGTVWAAGRHCHMIFNVDGTVVLPRINVVVAGEQTTTVPAASLGVSLGLRFLP